MILSGHKYYVQGFIYIFRLILKKLPTIVHGYVSSCLNLFIIIKPNEKFNNKMLIDQL